MKRTTSFRLSDEANEILEIKASAFDLSKTKILECMIHEFSPSTLKEKKQQRIDRDKLFFKFLNSEFKVSPTFILKKTKKANKLWKTWFNGYLSGWDLFQLRKSTSFFRSSRSDITKEWFRQRGLK